MSSRHYATSLCKDLTFYVLSYVVTCSISNGYDYLSALFPLLLEISVLMLRLLVQDT